MDLIFDEGMNNKIELSRDDNLSDNINEQKTLTSDFA